MQFLQTESSQTDHWKAKLLTGPPLIRPARNYIFPREVLGEEDALARGSLWIEVQPAKGGTFLAQCALGFVGTGVATGLWQAPEPSILLAIAGGYAYAIHTDAPETTQLLPMRPVVEVHAAPEADAFALVGFHAIYILGANEAWTSPRLSWEGVHIVSVKGEMLHGTGWHMRSDRELPFTLNLRTRELTGGAFLP